MAKMAELKKYLNYEFSSGCYTGDDYKTFQTKYINYLKAMCKANPEDDGKASCEKVALPLG